MRVDDGAVVYLNGVEVIRDTMPAGTIGHTTLAGLTDGSHGDRQRLFRHRSVARPSRHEHPRRRGPPELRVVERHDVLPELRRLWPVGDHADHDDHDQRTTTTTTDHDHLDHDHHVDVGPGGDHDVGGVDHLADHLARDHLARDHRLGVDHRPHDERRNHDDSDDRADHDAPPVGTPFDLPPSATWAYLDNGTDPGSAWRAAGFDDAAWKRGVGEFGYGDGDENTVVGFGPTESRKYCTTYFRTRFTANATPTA